MSLPDDFEVRVGDALEELKKLPDECVQMCVTSPPYWGLRDYGVDGQLGLEPTPEEYVEKLVAIFGEVWRVLRDDGTLWLNLGDSYTANRSYQVSDQKHTAHEYGESNAQGVPAGLKPKDMVGIPWRVAFALQEDGWWLRSDIIWHKPNPMPESVTDRPTSAHEHIFLLAKSKTYYYDHEAIKEDANCAGQQVTYGPGSKNKRAGDEVNDRRTLIERDIEVGSKRNKRDVWTVTTKPYPDAHFAVYPPELIVPPIKAGSAKGDLVLDPFAGAGTTGVVCTALGRRFLGIELNEEYAEMARKRIMDTNPTLFK